MADYFYKLKERGRMLDDGINNLSEIWSAPHIHIGGHFRYAVNAGNKENLQETAKAHEATETILKTVIELKKNVENDVTESKKNLEEMRQFINDSRSICDDLMQQCSDIETLFVENGYVSPKEEVENFSNSECENISIKNSENPYVESTPYIPWKSKLKQFDASTPTERKIKNEFVKDEFLTPLTQMLHTSRISKTARPTPPVLSRYCKDL